MSMVVEWIDIEDQVKRWVESGRTLSWIAQQLRARGYDATIDSIHVYAKRRGWKKPSRNYDEFIPWEVRREHAGSIHLRMLRALGRLAAGREITDKRTAKYFPGWLDELRAADAVVVYDPERYEGFYLDARRPGDLEYIRPPEA